MVQYVETNLLMLRHPLFRQIVGAVVGATAATGLYGLYLGAGHLMGADPFDALTAALVGQPVARIVEPIDEPAPLPEIGAPARPRTLPTVPPPQPQPIPAETTPAAEPAASEPAPTTETSEPRLDPAPIMAAASSSSLPAAMPDLTTKAAALPSSGPGEWLLLSAAAGAAAGWHRRRLVALFA